MEGILATLDGRAKRRLLEGMWNCREARLRTRYLIVLTLADGHSPSETARRVKVARSTVYRVADRFREVGEAGLVDRREENGELKLDEDYLTVLEEVVGSSPEEHGWLRPTWTREMLVATLQEKTGVHVDPSTMSRALQQIDARRAPPRPRVACPWSRQKKNRRLRAIRKLVDNLPDDEVAVYADEVDIHLNPKIGMDWMLPGQQKEVLTPGKNEKRYLAGAQDAHSGELHWVEGDSKNSLLFIQLLWKLVNHYSAANRIHVILDNYSIHSTEQVKVSLETEEGRRLELHFLPPYCPDDNKIERTWQDLHANVTRNHTCTDMTELMQRVRNYLRRRNRQPNSTPGSQQAA